jgi:methionine-gamma-lyase
MEGDQYRSHVSPIYQTSTFTFESVDAGAKYFSHEEGGASHCYSRIENPTVQLLEKAMADLEAHGSGGQEDLEALAFASGMSAISAGMMALGKGGIVLAQDALYAGTDQLKAGLAAEYGVTVNTFDGTSVQSFEQALAEAQGPVKLVYLESIANPVMRLTDIQAISARAHEAGALVMIDNTFCTPYFMQPIALGADVVAYSTTKYQGGHGNIVGGVLVGRKGLLHDSEVQRYRKFFGGIPGPFDAWLTLQGLKTMAVRMERHGENAMAVAQWLEKDPRVSTVWYPGLESHPDHELAKQEMPQGFGGMIGFELAGGAKAGELMMDRVQLCTLAVSLGAVDTLIQHPASMTHAKVDPEVRRQTGISDGLVRLSVGLEAVDDLISDLDQAMG